MNRFFTLLLAASCLTAFGQVTYPYNPDGNADSAIGVSDIQDLLTVYGSPFTPSEIMIEDSTLSSWIEYITTELQHVQQSQGNNDSNAFSVDIGLPQEIEVVHLPGQAHYYGSDNWFFYSLEFEQGGFLTVNLGKARILRVAKSDSLDLYDYDTGVALIDTPPDVYHHDFAPDGVTIPVHSSQKVILMIANGDIGKTTWTPIQNDYEEPVQDNLGPCQGEFTVNYHGYDYELVEIGDQCWFAENLRTKLYTNGDSITEGILPTNNAFYVDGIDPRRYRRPCVPGQGPPSGAAAELWGGLLYSGFCALDNNVCPLGFHVPTMGEFQTLSENVTGGDGEAAFNLIASIPLAYGTNSSGFNAIPIGPATNNGCHNYEEAVFHSSEIVNYFSGYIEYVGMFEIRYNETSLCCGASAVETAAPIRCIKDAE